MTSYVKMTTAETGAMERQLADLNHLSQYTVSRVERQIQGAETLVPPDETAHGGFPPGIEATVEWPGDVGQ